MDIDFTTKEGLFFVVEKEPVKEKTRKKKRTVTVASENLRKMMIDRINGNTGDC